MGLIRSTSKVESVNQLGNNNHLMNSHLYYEEILSIFTTYMQCLGKTEKRKAFKSCPLSYLPQLTPDYCQ